LWGEEDGERSKGGGETTRGTPRWGKKKTNWAQEKRGSCGLITCKKKKNLVLKSQETLKRGKGGWAREIKGSAGWLVVNSKVKVDGGGEIN